MNSRLSCCRASISLPPRSSATRCSISCSGTPRFLQGVVLLAVAAVLDELAHLLLERLGAGDAELLRERLQRRGLEALDAVDADEDGDGLILDPFILMTGRAGHADGDGIADLLVG